MTKTKSISSCRSWGPIYVYLWHGTPLQGAASGGVATVAANLGRQEPRTSRTSSQAARSGHPAWWKHLEAPNCRWSSAIQYLKSRQHANPWSSHAPESCRFDLLGIWTSPSQLCPRPETQPPCRVRIAQRLSGKGTSTQWCRRKSGTCHFPSSHPVRSWKNHKKISPTRRTAISGSSFQDHHIAFEARWVFSSHPRLLSAALSSNPQSPSVDLRSSFRVLHTSSWIFGLLLCPSLVLPPEVELSLLQETTGKPSGSESFLLHVEAIEARWKCQDHIWRTSRQKQRHLFEFQDMHERIWEALDPTLSEEPPVGQWTLQALLLQPLSTHQLRPWNLQGANPTFSSTVQCLRG